MKNSNIFHTKILNLNKLFWSEQNFSRNCLAMLSMNNASQNVYSVGKNSGVLRGGTSKAERCACAGPPWAPRPLPTLENFLFTCDASSYLLCLYPCMCLCKVVDISWYKSSKPGSAGNRKQSLSIKTTFSNSQQNTASVFLNSARNVFWLTLIAMGGSTTSLSPPSENNYFAWRHPYFD